MKSDGLDLVSGTVTSGGDTVNSTAWVRFNGQGVVSIIDSYNISSVGDIGVGTYTLNFETNMNNNNYAVSGCANGEAAVAFFGAIRPDTATVSSQQIGVSAGGGTFSGNFDSVGIHVKIHGGV